jgi:hypothetical protein
VAIAATYIVIIEDELEEDRDEGAEVRDELEKDAFSEDLETYLEDSWDATPRKRRIRPRKNQVTNQECANKLLRPLADRLPSIPKVPRKPPWKPSMKDITATAIEWTKELAGTGYLATVLAPVWEISR